jgi:hypothetical protein
MVKTVPLGIAVEDFGLGHARTNGLPGHGLVIIAFFFRLLTAHADGLVIVHR